MIESISFALLGFLGLQLIIAFFNLVFKQKMTAISSTEKVSILVPARNEEHNIQRLINTVQNLSYSNIELIICDDNSTDNTVSIINKNIKEGVAIQLIKNKTLPKDWLGKNYACYTLSKNASGTFFLFIDADVSISNNIIEQCLGHSRANDLSLISIFPKQTMKTSAEKLTVPLMNYILLSLLPLPLVQYSRFRSLAAANGQFMFFNANDYNKLNPHKTARNNKVEDIAIARFFKKNKLKISCIASNSNVNCRMYQDYNESIHGFSKNINAYFGGSYFTTFLFWLVSSFGFLFILIFYHWTFGLLALCTLFLTRIIISIQSNQNPIMNLQYMFGQQLTLGVIAFISLKNSITKSQQWKGRNIPS